MFGLGRSYLVSFNATLDRGSNKNDGTLSVILLTTDLTRRNTIPSPGNNLTGQKAHVWVGQPITGDYQWPGVNMSQVLVVPPYAKLFPDTNDVPTGNSTTVKDARPEAFEEVPPWP